jgi:endogenous inhibitor of DNA gyrase (YacG/DUF329 family)
MRKCPECGKPVEWQNNPWRPFCSERCRLIDFDRWTSEEYRVPAEEAAIPPETGRESNAFPLTGGNESEPDQ